MGIVGSSYIYGINLTNMEKLTNEPNWVSNCCYVAFPIPEMGLCPKCNDHCVFVVVDKVGNETIFEL